MKNEIKGALTAIALVAPFVFPGQAVADPPFCVEPNQRVIVEALCSVSIDGESLVMNADAYTQGGGPSEDVRPTTIGRSCEFFLHSPGPPAVPGDGNAPASFQFSNLGFGPVPFQCSANLCSAVVDGENSATAHAVLEVRICGTSDFITVHGDCGEHLKKFDLDLCPS